MPQPICPRLSSIEALRAEARLLSLAGLMLLGGGLPLTLGLVALAINPGGLSPAIPLAFGGAPVLLGYLSCHFASLRLAAAKQLAQKRG